MTDLVTAVATAAQIKIADKAYTLSPLTLDDYADWDRWMRDDYLALMRTPAIEALADGDRRAAQQRLIDRASTLSLINPPHHDPAAMQQLIKYARGVPGAVRLLWLGIKHKHPDVPIEEIAELLNDPGLVEQAMDEIDRINALPDDGKKKTTETTETADASE